MTSNKKRPDWWTHTRRYCPRQLQASPDLTVPESQPNIIAQNNLDRRRQMNQLINAGLAKTEKEAKVKESLGVAMDVVLSAKNIISAAIQAVPQAALAWTGICIALEVRLFRARYFTY